MYNKILRIIFILLIVIIVGFYIWDIVVNHSEPTDNLFRTLAVVCMCIAGLIRVGNVRGRRSLEFYEANYADVVGDAFYHSPVWRKKLLCATRLYDENRLEKAAKYLIDLQNKCQTENDYVAVGTFLALTFDDMGLYEEAMHVYRKLIIMGRADGRIYGNVGHLNSKLGNDKEAMECYKKALSMGGNKEYIYNNIANLYFKQNKLDEAIENAKKALEVNNNFRQSADLLAIICSMQENKEEADKYFHIALASGTNPKVLNEAIAHYMAKRNETESEEEN